MDRALGLAGSATVFLVGALCWFGVGGLIFYERIESSYVKSIEVPYRGHLSWEANQKAREPARQAAKASAKTDAIVYLVIGVSVALIYSWVIALRSTSVFYFMVTGGAGLLLHPGIRRVRVSLLNREEALSHLSSPELFKLLIVRLRNLAASGESNRVDLTELDEAIDIDLTPESKPPLRWEDVIQKIQKLLGLDRPVDLQNRSPPVDLADHQTTLF